MKTQLLGISIMLLGIAGGMIGDGTASSEVFCIVVTGIGFLISLGAYLGALAKNFRKKHLDKFLE